MSEAPMFARYIRPDEFAECRDGVMAVEGLDRALWAFVKRYKEPFPGEDSCPEGPGRDSLARFWPELSPEHQAACVAIEEANEARMKKMMRDYYQERRLPVPEEYQ